MFNEQERELKIGLTKEQYETLLHSYEFDHSIRQVNTYYDDPEQILKNAGGAVRIRQIGDQNILTLKLPKDSITKYEYEMPVAESSIDNLSDEERKLIDDHIRLAGSLHPIASFTTIRNIKKLDYAELCLDQNDFGSVTDYELEYEYTRDHDGISVLNQILAPLGLKFEKNGPSKLARAISYTKIKS